MHAHIHTDNCRLMFTQRCMVPYVCINTITHTYLYMSMCRDTNIYTHSLTQSQVHIHTLVCIFMSKMHSHMHIYIRGRYMCMYSELHIDIYTQTIAKAHTDTHRHTYTLVNTGMYAPIFFLSFLRAMFRLFHFLRVQLRLLDVFSPWRSVPDAESGFSTRSLWL